MSRPYTLCSRPSFSPHLTSGYAWLDNVRAYAENGTVTLSGEVHSLLLRKVAQEAAHSVPVVHRVQRHVRVA